MIEVPDLTRRSTRSRRGGGYKLLRCRPMSRRILIEPTVRDPLSGLGEHAGIIEVAVAHTKE